MSLLNSLVALASILLCNDSIILKQNQSNIKTLSNALYFYKHLPEVLMQYQYLLILENKAFLENNKVLKEYY